LACRRSTLTRRTWARTRWASRPLTASRPTPAHSTRPRQARPGAARMWPNTHCHRAMPPGALLLTHRIGCARGRVWSCRRGGGVCAPAAAGAQEHMRCIAGSAAGEAHASLSILATLALSQTHMYGSGTDRRHPAGASRAQAGRAARSATRRPRARVRRARRRSSPRRPATRPRTRWARRWAATPRRRCGPECAGSAWAGQWVVPHVRCLTEWA